MMEVTKHGTGEVSFTHAGRRYFFPPLPDWPVAAVTAISKGDALAGLALVIGEEAAQSLLDDGFTMGQLAAVTDMLASDR